MKKTVLRCAAIGMLMFMTGCANNKSVVLTSDLEGKWAITAVEGESIVGKTENVPFLEFDIKENRVHGNAGCNIINGGFTREEGENASLKFSQMMSTMMACPDLEMERRILELIEAVRSVEKKEDGALVLLDEKNAEMLKLEKKAEQ